MTVPEFDLADRMRKALRDAGIERPGDGRLPRCRPDTVSTWINGRIQPSVQTLRLWSLRCGVDYEWLSTGRSPSPGLTSPTNPVGIRKPGTKAPLHGLAAAAASAWPP